MDKVYEFCNYVSKLYKEDGFSDEISTVYPMGYYLSAMRAQAKLVLLSDLPLKKKKEWFNYVRNHSYTKLIDQRYPLNKMTLFQRIHFYVFYHNHFITLLSLVKVFKLLKKK